MKKFLTALALACVVGCMPFVYAELETDVSGTVAATSEQRTKLRAAITGGPSISNDVNILVTPGLSVSNPGGTRFSAEIQVATSSTLKLVTTRTVASVSTSTTILLNGGTALTAGAQTLVSWIGVPNETYNLRLGTTSALNRLVIVEAWGGNTISVSQARSAGGGSSDPTLGGDLSGTASAASVVGLTGTGNTVSGPAGVGLKIVGGVGGALSLYNNDADGAGFTCNSDGSLEISAAGTNKSITLTPSGTGTVTATGPLRLGTGVGAGDVKFVTTSGNDLNLKNGSDGNAITLTTAAMVIAAGEHYLSSALHGLGSAVAIKWSSDATGAANYDTGLARSAAGVLKVTDGASGLGSLLVQDATVSGNLTVTGTITAGSIVGAAFPTGHLYRLPVSYASATTITLGAGNCRSSTDAANITITSNKVLDVTGSNGALGLNAYAFTQTATTHGTDTFELSGSGVFAEGDAIERRAGVGTLTTVGTAVTFSSTLNDLAVNDVIGDTTGGYARLTAYNPGAGTGTLSAALPGGNVTASATWWITENLTVWPGATAGDKRRVKTISADHITVKVEGGALASSAAGVSLKAGVEVVSEWLAVYAANVGGSTGFLSTQRTTPYSMTDLTAYRRVGWVYNDSSGNIRPFFERNGRVWPNDTSTAAVALSGGSATAWTDVDCSAFAPPTATDFQVVLYAAGSSGAASGWNGFVRPRGGSDSSVDWGARVSNHGSSVADVSNSVLLPCDGAQFIQYANQSASRSLSIVFTSYTDSR